jgi:hypothetical protein
MNRTKATCITGIRRKTRSRIKIHFQRRPDFRLFFFRVKGFASRGFTGVRGFALRGLVERRGIMIGAAWGETF